MTIMTDPTLVKPQSRLNGTGISNRLVATRLSLRNRLDCMIPLVQLRKEDTDIVACLQAGMFVRRRGEKDCEEAF